MTTRTTKNDRPDDPLADDIESGQTSPHPLDEWLRHELNSLFDTVRDGPLPPDMAELADRLESALAAPRSRKQSD